MRQTAVLFFFSFVELFVHGSGNVDFQKCDALSSTINECMGNSIQIFLRNLGAPIVKGSPAEVHEPLTVGFVSLGSTGINLTDVKTYGWSRTDLKSLTLNSTIHVASFDGRTPQFKLKGHYQADAKVLDKTLKGEGLFITILENVTYTLIIKMEVEERKGTKYWKVIDGRISVDPEKVRFKFENQPEDLNREINENWRAVFAEFKSGYEEALITAYLRLGRFLFTVTPISFFIDNY